MPRTARLDAAGILHHVIIRGIEQRRIFTNDTDRENLLARIKTLLPETSTSKEKRYVDARSILCYWAVRVLGISTTGMARHLNMTQPAITYAAKRGIIIVQKGNYNL